MEHNLDDSLNLDTAMGVDFEPQEETVCHQGDIILDQDDIQMEFVYEEKPILMETGGEEITISDIIGGQFNLQDLPSDQNELGILNQGEHNYNTATQSDNMLELQVDPQPIVVPAASNEQRTLKIPQRKETDSTMPKPIAIAPKPPTLTQMAPKVYGKPVNIAPKPAVVTNKSVLKTGVGNNKGNTVFAQIGKKLVMMPATAQKIKFISTSQANTGTAQRIIKTEPTQVQILPNKNVSLQGKPMKIITLQGQTNVSSDPKPVITKLLPAGQLQQHRFVTLQPNKNLQHGQKVLMTPSHQMVKLPNKQEIISIKPVTKLLPKVSPSKFLVSAATSMQNVDKTTTSSSMQAKTQGEPVQTQIHQIHVPGKGVQYIRLVTNSGAAPTKTVLKPQHKLINVSSKSLVASDTQAMDTKPPKLVKIAPVKTVASSQVKCSQSLLAPISSVPEPQSIEEVESDSNVQADVKPSLSSLQNAIDQGLNQEISVDFNNQDLSVEAQNTTDTSSHDQSHPLIVIPSYEHTVEVREEYNNSNDSQNLEISTGRERTTSVSTYDSNCNTSEPALETSELAMRPRKACNCTKSQCLKLYCDCFANGEFCNQCNCDNCYNNLEHEHLRQKAIRGCLDRNPHAFKPKIGKSKIGGPEIVRRHNKGCNCKKSGCLKNYCECYEARIACTMMCKCVGCRNVCDSLERGRLECSRPDARPPPLRLDSGRQPCTMLSYSVVEAVCQCLVATGQEAREDPHAHVIHEFARALHDIIAASRSPLALHHSSA